MDRIGIFVIYNKYGRVERYVLYLLSALKKCCTELVVVCNGNMQLNEKKKLYYYTNYVFIRENYGYDCGAIKDVLLHFVGWDQVLLYDELLIMNDTCYGPIYPLDNIFEQMREKECGFWGMTGQEPLASDEETWGMKELPYHIQSYFVVFRKALLHDPCFRMFWDEIEPKNDYYETVKNYELRMTNYFIEHGFSCAAYVQRKDYYPYCFVFYEPYQLLYSCKMPFIKRKAVIFRLEDELSFFSSLERKRLFDYLKHGRYYNIDMILEDFAHRYGNMVDVIYDIVDIKDLKIFRNNHKKVFIYGAGAFAQMVTNTFNMEGVSFDGYLVSDGHKQEEMKNGKNIYELSDIDDAQKDTVGIVLGMDKRNRSAVWKTLKQHRFTYIFNK